MKAVHFFSFGKHTSVSIFFLRHNSVSIETTTYLMKLNLYFQDFLGINSVVECGCHSHNQPLWVQRLALRSYNCVELLCLRSHVVADKDKFRSRWRLEGWNGCKKFKLTHILAFIMSGTLIDLKGCHRSQVAWPKQAPLLTHTTL